MSQSLLDKKLVQQRIGSLSNPVGSITEQPQDPSNYEVVGTYGKIRHRGSFSSENPYYSQLVLASNNQDRDAMYERAVEWEADRANYELQSPFMEARRQREAGINPDLASASGGSSGVSSPAMADQTPMTQTNNQYSNADRIIAGISSATNLISSVASLSTAIGSLTQMSSLLPSQRKSAEAEAKVAEETAGARVDMMQSAASSASLDALSAGLNFTGKLAGWITPDMSMEDAAPILRSAGLSDDSHQQHFDNVQAFHKNPKMQADYQEGLLRSKTAGAKNQAYTEQRLLRTLDYIAQSEELMAECNFYRSCIDNDIQELLASSDYAQTQGIAILGEANNALLSNDVNKNKLDLNLQNLVFDIKAFGKQIDHIRYLRVLVDQERDRVLSGAVTFETEQNRTAYLDSLYEKMMYLDIVGTSQLGSLRQVFTSLAQNRYINDSTRLGGDMGMLGYDSRAEYANVLFSDIVSNPDLLKNLISSGLNLATGGLKLGQNLIP